MWIKVKKGKGLHKKTTCFTKIRFSSRFHNQATNWDGMVTSNTTSTPISEGAVEGQNEAQSSCSGLTDEFRHMPGMAVWEHRQQTLSRISVGLSGQFQYRSQLHTNISYRYWFSVFFTVESTAEGMLGVTHLPRLLPTGFSHRSPICKSL